MVIEVAIGNDSAAIKEDVVNPGRERSAIREKDRGNKVAARWNRLIGIRNDTAQVVIVHRIQTCAIDRTCGLRLVYAITKG